jgi:WD40 repeat protein
MSSRGRLVALVFAGSLAAKKAVPLSRGTFPTDSPLFVGLPDNMCQSAHWGYLFKGKLRFTYKDHDEVISAGEAYYAPPGHTVECLAISRDGRKAVTGTFGGEMRIWDLKTGKETARYQAHQGACWWVDFSPDGIRRSLESSLSLKRDARGVVDGITAEDIGKFPDTNLAESLQRITGVSIDRVNGEGSRVTVRGFGPGYNLVTLNGRAMPTASIASIGQDQNGDFVTGNTRSFEFSNLASEGVNRLEVYKRQTQPIEDYYRRAGLLAEIQQEFRRIQEFLRNRTARS